LLRAAAEMVAAEYAAAPAQVAVEEEAAALAAGLAGESSVFLGNQAGRLRDICRSSSRWRSNSDGGAFCNCPRSDRAFRILGRKARRHTVCSGSSAQGRGCANSARARPILDVQEKRGEVEKSFAELNSLLVAAQLECCTVLEQVKAVAIAQDAAELSQEIAA
jgi:hypothetical protein